jgi:hypothetical protein
MAVQIWAETLGLVCHPEYYKLGDETVTVRKTILQQWAFMVHFSGYYLPTTTQLIPQNISMTRHQSIWHVLRSKFTLLFLSIILSLAI